MIKTLTFAALHFSNAFLVAYLLTGSMLIGGLIALIEPFINTISFYVHEKVWEHWSLLKKYKHMIKIKTLSFGVVHFSVAFSVTYVLTGSFILGGLMAMLEPSLNTIVFYFHEKVWQAFSRGKKRKQRYEYCMHRRLVATGKLMANKKILDDIS